MNGVRAEYKELVDELGFYLSNEPGELILNLTTETPATEIDLRDPSPPPLKSKSVSQAPAAPPSHLELAANTKCTLCSGRIYPVKKYLRSGKRPILALYYNGPIKPDDGLVDRSLRQIFGSAEGDDFFKRLLGALNYQSEDIFYQEFPACHFNHLRSLPEDWQQRSENCFKHLKATIAANQIKLILLIGPPALFLLGENVGKEAARSGELQQLQIEELKVPAVALRSPAALQALEQLRLRLKGSQEPGAEEKYQQVLSEEKEIKNTILKSLRHAVESCL